MKKLGSLFLVIIMLLALCGCSESTNNIQSEYVGTWKGSKYLGGGEDIVRNYKYATLLLNEDGTGTYTVTYGQDEPTTLELEWSYDQTNQTIDVFFPKQNSSSAFEIKDDDGKTYLQMGNITAPLYRE